MSAMEKIVRLAWPDSTIGPSDKHMPESEAVLVVDAHGAHRRYWMSSWLDIKEVEQAVMARGLAEAYGHELLCAMKLTNIYLMADSAYIARIATVPTKVRAQALLALAEKHAESAT